MIQWFLGEHGQKGVGHLVHETQKYGARNPYKVVHGRSGLFGKTYFAQKIGEMGQK